MHLGNIDFYSLVHIYYFHFFGCIFIYRPEKFWFYMNTIFNLVSRAAECPPEIRKLGRAFCKFCDSLVSNIHPRALAPATLAQPVGVLYLYYQAAHSCSLQPWPTCTTQTQLVQLSALLCFTCFSFWYSRQISKHGFSMDNKFGLD